MGQAAWEVLGGGSVLAGLTKREREEGRVGIWYLYVIACWKVYMLGLRDVLVLYAVFVGG
jgi:hypothetical protein